MKLGIALLKLWRFFIGNRSFITEINGDLWIASNAVYDGTNWNRVDTTKYAFAIQIQGYGNIPGETFQGVNIWKAAPGANPIGPFLAVGGWETLAIGTVYSGFVIGGSTIEVDGSGATNGYVRLTCLNDGLHLTFNAYWDGTNWRADVLNAWNLDYWLDIGGLIITRRAYTSTNPIIWGTGERTKARVYRDISNQSLSAATDTKVQLNAMSYDYLTWFDISTNYRYTINSERANGQYLVTAAVNFSPPSAASQATIWIAKNGVRVAKVQGQIQSGSYNLTLTVTDVIELSAGDYIELWARCEATTSINYGSDKTFMALAKLL
jgi:hypothetical protein